MKKLLLAILMVAILVIAIPAAAMAAPDQKLQKKMDVSFSVQGVSWQPCYENSTTLKEFAYYTGVVASASGNSQIKKGTPITVKQDITYAGFWSDPNDPATFVPMSGDEKGTIVINSTFNSDFSPNIDYSNYAKISIISHIMVNYTTYSASDVGTWQTQKTNGKLEILDGASGNWLANISLLGMGGTATASGFLRPDKH